MRVEKISRVKYPAHSSTHQLESSCCGWTICPSWYAGRGSKYRWRHWFRWGKNGHMRSILCYRQCCLFSSGITTCSLPLSYPLLPSIIPLYCNLHPIPLSCLHHHLRHPLLPNLRILAFQNEDKILTMGWYASVFASCCVLVTWGSACWDRIWRAFSLVPRPLVPWLLMMDPIRQ